MQEIMARGGEKKWRKAVRGKKKKIVLPNVNDFVQPINRTYCLLCCCSDC